MEKRTSEIGIKYLIFNKSFSNLFITVLSDFKKIFTVSHIFNLRFEVAEFEVILHYGATIQISSFVICVTIIMLAIFFNFIYNI